MSKWIKWTAGTDQKPEVLRIARTLNISHAETVLALIRLWCWADESTQDGVIQGVTLADVDGVVRLPGFAEATREAGWIVEQDGGIVLPNFDRHMGRSAKRRLMGAERARRFRAKQKP